MENNQLYSPERIYHLRQGKYSDNIRYAQMKRVFAVFKSEPKTMLMASIETGVLRANICRYVAEWELQGRIAIYRKGLCPITKYRAGFYTTNPAIFPKLCRTTKDKTE